MTHEILLQDEAVGLVALVLVNCPLNSACFSVLCSCRCAFLFYLLRFGIYFITTFLFLYHIEISPNYCDACSILSNNIYNFFVENMIWVILSIQM